MYNGILIMDKPRDFTSHDVVAKLRGVLRQRRIGHAGTLDPMATGVLVVLLGTATRCSDWASGQDKRYLATLRLGLETDTQDITGRVQAQQESTCTAAQVDAILARFRGAQQQIPPMYSAVQIDGKRLYKLARKGVELDVPPRDIFIQNLALVAQEGACDFALDVTCSKGTYVRTLCHDIGRALGVGGCLSALRRVQSGNFGLDNALDFDAVRALHQDGTLAAHLLPPDAVFSAWPRVQLNQEGTGRAQNGAFLAQGHIAQGTVPPIDGRARVYGADGTFLMIAQSKPLEKGGAALFCTATFWEKGTD